MRLQRAGAQGFAKSHSSRTLAGLCCGCCLPVLHCAASRQLCPYCSCTAVCQAAQGRGRSRWAMKLIHQCHCSTCMSSQHSLHTTILHSEGLNTLLDPQICCMQVLPQVLHGYDGKLHHSDRHTPSLQGTTTAVHALLHMPGCLCTRLNLGVCPAVPQTTCMPAMCLRVCVCHGACCCRFGWCVE